MQLAKVEGFLVDDGGDETLLHETVDVSAADAGEHERRDQRSSRRNRDCERSSSERMLHFGGPPWARDFRGRAHPYRLTGTCKYRFDATCKVLVMPGRPTSRDAILTAALQAVAERGPDKLTMSAVANAAGVSRPTLYRWFPTKDHLLAAIAVYEEEQFDLGVRALVGAHRSPARRLDAFLAFTVNYLDGLIGPDPIGADPRFALQSLARAAGAGRDHYAVARRRAATGACRTHRRVDERTGCRNVPARRDLALPHPPPRTRRVAREPQELGRLAPALIDTRGHLSKVYRKERHGRKRSARRSRLRGDPVHPRAEVGK